MLWLTSYWPEGLDFGLLGIAKTASMERSIIRLREMKAM